MTDIQLRREGCALLRSGGNHDIYVNRKTGKKQPVPRHSEIDERLAKMPKLNNPPPPSPSQPQQTDDF